MLKELNLYENMGTPKFYWELLNNLNNEHETKWTIKAIQEYFINRIIDGRSIFDGCIPLAESIDLIKVNKDDTVILNPSFAEYLRSEKFMTDKFLEKFFLRYKDDDVFHEIFCSENISYDIIYRSIQINNSAFKFKYSNFKQLLIDFSFLHFHPAPEIKKFIINSRFHKLFNKIVLPEIKKRKFGIDDLKKSLEKNLIHGEEAEKFVLKYEKKRLKNRDGIEWVAKYSVSEGYDIASFNSNESIENDRFIEVKSYVGTPNFFWSRNEMDISRIKTINYFLYLVDRNFSNNKDYEPIIVNNPYIEILKNDMKWNKSVEKLKVTIKE